MLSHLYFIHTVVYKSVGDLYPLHWYVCIGLQIQMLVIKISENPKSKCSFLIFFITCIKLDGHKCNFQPKPVTVCCSGTIRMLTYEYLLKDCPVGIPIDPNNQFYNMRLF